MYKKDMYNVTKLLFYFLFIKESFNWSNFPQK